MHRATRFLLIWLSLLLFVSFAALAETRAGTLIETLDESRADYEGNRVARISLVRGDVQIRRHDSREWEEAVPNLPLVEGDRLATGQDALVEIQFDRDNYLRLAEDSILKIVTLSDSGVAVSLPEGSLSLRVGRFKKNREFFEIDAPETTVAIEREGLYRVDAPAATRQSELLVTVRDNGQARIYSETSGYLIRSGRTARILLDGESAGDVDFSAAFNRDRFDDWIAEREDRLQRRRRAEYYGYYDPAIYGADDLNEFGEWIDTDRYGWVWRPSRAAIAAYEDWSPFRHGHWRYIPGYGWTWIAREPWGWATSHYGRWVWIDNGWSWCPYEDRFRRRSRWQAALVIFVNAGRNICWYPQPWGYFSSYNHRSRRVIYNTTIINNNVVVNPTPTPSPANPNDTPRRGIDQLRERRLPLEDAYAGAVSKMPLDSFGKVTRGIERVEKIEAIRAIDAFKKGEKQIDLPEYNENADAKVKRGLEVVSRRPSLKEAERELESNQKIGAMPREKNTASDAKLRDERIFNGRITNARETGADSKQESADDSAKQPRLGVFDRQTRRRDEQSGGNERGEKSGDEKSGAEKSRDDSFERPPTRQPRFPGKVDRDNDEREITTERPRRENRDENRDENRKQRDDSDNNRRPTYEPPAQREPERREEPKREEPRYEPPPRREEPRYEPPKQEEPKRQEPPPPPREEPKREAPPPSKSPEKPGTERKR